MIMNEARYEAAKKRNIHMNRIKGNQTRWVADSGQDVVNKCMDFLFENGEFAPSSIEKDYGVEFITNPIVKVSLGSFYGKMRESVSQWGRLTYSQEKAVLEMIEKAKARIEERAAAKAEQAATAKHVGVIGERSTFDVTVLFVSFYEGTFGKVYIHGMKDAAGNVLIHKGNALLVDIIDGYPRQVKKGEQIRFSATVKEHGTRDGVKQTIVTRPSHADFLE